jgi:hypothetical protein
MQCQVICGILGLAVLTARAQPPASQPTTAPATRPVEPKVQALIAQLGDDDPHRRDAATVALRRLGKEALPGLEAATLAEDPQIRISAEALVAEQKEKDHPRQVADNDTTTPNGIVIRPDILGLRRNMQGRMEFKVQIVGNGQMTRDMSINDNGHKVHVHEDANGVTVEVTDNGQTQNYTAKNLAELKEKQPEGYKIYKQYVIDAGQP